MQRVVICPDTAGLVLTYEVLARLFSAHPEAFSEPMPPADFGLPEGASASQVEHATLFGVLDGDGMLRFFEHNEARWRALAWLADEVERLDGKVCWRDKRAKVVELPDEVKWYLYVGEDGSESIHEEHRVWR